MDENWFTIKKLFSNVWGIAEFKHPEEVISYLFVGENKALLCDTGLGIYNIGDIVKQITHLPVMVINTHKHYDHIGGNKYFKKILNAGNKSKILFPPFQFIIISTPGHTPDSVCIFEKNLQILVSGDTFYPGPIYLHLKESNFKDYKRSIHKLDNFEIKTILPGHNKFKSRSRNLKLLNYKLTLLSSHISGFENINITRNISLKMK